MNEGSALAEHPLTIVIPMAGAGSRFVAAGYQVPKPLIPVHGVEMIRLVIDNLTPQTPHRFVFVCQRAHVERYQLDDSLARWAPGSSLIQVDGLTEGAAVSVLAAQHEIDPDAPLMIANSDQWVDTSIDEYITAQLGHDGLIMTMRDHDPKWSYVRYDAHGRLVGVVEKQVVSTEATVGIYNAARASLMLDALRELVARDRRTNGEFYVAPAYDLMIESGARVTTVDVGDVSTVMHGLGTPVDLEAFLAHPRSRDAAARASS